MKKSIVILLTSSLLIFGTTATFADIYVSGYSNSYTPKEGYYQGKIVNVDIGYSTTTTPDGKIKKFPEVMVRTINKAGDDLSFSFREEDVKEGLAFMSAIGKNMGVFITIDKTSHMVVGSTISVSLPSG